VTEFPPLLNDATSALAGARRSSGGLRQTFSQAGQEAAENLLNKAVRRLEQDDQVGARRFVDRALALPYDDFEDTQPCLWVAHMLLFTANADELEASPEGDTGWLDRAVTAMEAAGPVAAEEVRFCLRVFLDSVYSLSPSEQRRVRQLTSGVPVDPEPFASAGGSTAVRADAVLDVLGVLLRYEVA
jgi:hypothetical protein